MQVKAKANWQQSFFNKNALQGLSLKGVLLRILICNGVAVNLILPLYDFDSYDVREKEHPDMNLRPSGKTATSLLTRVQEVYYMEKGYFSDSLEELSRETGGAIRDTWIYSYRILSPMVPAQELKEPGLPAPPASEIVFLLGQAKHPYPSFKNYIGVVYASQREINKGKFETLLSALCEIDSWTPFPYTLPTIKAGEIQCPPGSRLEKSRTWTLEK